LLRGLLDRFTQEAREDSQLQALDALTIVRELNQSLLAAMLEIDHAGPLYQWLSRLSFVEQRETGIVMHQLAREVLWADISSRASGRYTVFARNAVNWIVDRLEASTALTWHQAAGLAADAMYALRAAPLVREYMNLDADQSLYLDAWHEDDATEAHAMIARHEGEESLYWFRFWQARVPGSTVVIRDVDRRVRGLFLKLNMENLAPEDRQADPMTRILWQALETQFDFAPGDHVPFIRHWVTHDYAVSNSPEKTIILMAIHTYNLVARHLRLSAQVFDEATEWQPLAASLGIHLLEGSDTVIGGKDWQIYYNDWHVESPPHYYHLLADRMLGIGDGQPAKTVDTGARSLGESAFRQAVDDALKHLHEPERMQENPLLDSGILQCRGGAGGTDTATQVQVLEQVLRNTLAYLVDSGSMEARKAEILRRVWLDGPVNRSQLARSMHISYSTLRRYLLGAQKMLATQLWLDY